MNIYRFLADLVVVFHLAYVSFVVLGLGAILLGGWRKWSWVRNFRFRLLHFVMIAVVVFESLFGIVCPLTSWEDALREKAGETIVKGSFIGRMAHEIMYVQLSPGVLTTCYCVFGAIVLATLFLVPPRGPRRDAKGEGGREKIEE